MRPELVKSIAEIRSRVAEAKGRRQTVGLVPTMGALHPGHVALMERARQDSEVVVVSIFVNPIQFDRKEDYEKCARNLEIDLDVCARHGVDLVFAPEASEMYPQPLDTYVDVARVSERLCGEFRSGHFRGVATVVAKLFNIVQAEAAYFGEKDRQQLVVIRKMVDDLNIPVKIIGVPTVREKDGLAMSSRNQRLSPEERSIAPTLFKALEAAREEIKRGCRDSAKVKQVGLALLETLPQMRVEYFDVVDAANMQPVSRITGPVSIAGAVWLGSTRLIDNVTWG